MPPLASRIARWLVGAALCLGPVACDGGGAGGGASPQAMVNACEAGCAARHDGCPTTDLAQCDFGCAALANLRSECRALLVTLADCEAQAAWQCLPTSEFVATPVDADACAAEASAFEAACPFGS